MADNKPYTFSKDSAVRVVDATQWVEKQPTYVGGTTRRRPEAPPSKGMINIIKHNYPLKDISAFNPPTEPGEEPDYDNWICQLTIVKTGRGWSDYITTDDNDLPSWNITEFLEDVNYTTTEKKKEVLALAYDFIAEEYKLSSFLAGGFQGVGLQASLEDKNEVIAYIELTINEDRTTISNISYTKTEFEYVGQSDDLYPVIIKDNKLIIKGTSFSFKDNNGDIQTETFDEDFYSVDIPSDGAHTLALYLSVDDGFQLILDNFMNDKTCIPLATFEVEGGTIVRYVNRTPKGLHQLPAIIGKYMFGSTDSLALRIFDYTISCGSKKFEITGDVFDPPADNVYIYLSVSFDGNTELIGNTEKPAESEDGKFNLLLLNVKSTVIDGKRQYLSHTEYSEGWQNSYGAGVWG